MFLGECQSRLYPHMRAKFNRGPTVVSKRGGYRHTYYETVTSMADLYNTANNVSTFFYVGYNIDKKCVKFRW